MYNSVPRGVIDYHLGNHLAGSVVALNFEHLSVAVGATETNICPLIRSRRETLRGRFAENNSTERIILYFKRFQVQNAREI